jgi:hypothetical protein
MKKEELKKRMAAAAAEEERALLESAPTAARDVQAEKQKAVSAGAKGDPVSVHLTTPEQTALVLEILGRWPDEGLVLYGGSPHRVVRRAGRAALDPHTRESLTGHVGRRVDFERRTNDKWVPADPPRKVIDDILSLPAYPGGVPALKGIKATPLLTRGGELIAATGLHPEHGFYLDLAPELEGMALPAVIDDKALARALARVIDPFHDFPVIDESAADLVALLFTLVLREHVDGVTPLFVVDANVPGTGKGLLCNVLSLIAYGAEASFSPGNVPTEELRKRLFALASQGESMHVLDNVEHRLWSSDLAAWLTAPLYTDRKLGESATFTFPNSLVIVATGNNVQVGGDIARRCSLIRLVSDRAHPEERTDFKYPRLLEHVRKSRKRILLAVYTIAAAWLRGGRVVPENAPQMGSFESWTAFASGLLHATNVSGLLDSRELVRGRDHDAEEYELLLARAHTSFGAKPFTAKELAAALDADDFPSSLGAAAQGSLTKRMGRLLTRIEGRAFGAEGLTLRHSGTVEKTKRYRVEVANG